MKGPTQLVKESVNEYGELHLDRERTDLLLRWLSVCERAILEQQENMGSLIKALIDAGIISGEHIDRIQRSMGGKDE